MSKIESVINYKNLNLKGTSQAGSNKKAENKNKFDLTDGLTLKEAKKIDKNGDGIITEKEYLAACEKQKIDKKDAKKYFNEFVSFCSKSSKNKEKPVKGFKTNTGKKYKIGYKDGNIDSVTINGKKYKVDATGIISNGKAKYDEKGNRIFDKNDIGRISADPKTGKITIKEIKNGKPTYEAEIKKSGKISWDKKYDKSGKISSKTEYDKSGNEKHTDFYDKKGKINKTADYTRFKHPYKKGVKVLKSEIKNSDGKTQKISYTYFNKKGEILTEIDTVPSHEINGEIDKPVSQGHTGDCWFLSGILALASTEQGRAAIKSSIKKNPDGSVDVILKGNTYKISAEEIKEHDTDEDRFDPYSVGDNDMLVLELAMEKYRKEHKDRDLNGGFTHEAIFAITGIKSQTKYRNDDSSDKGLTAEKIKDFLKKTAKNPKNTVLTFALDKGIYKFKKTNGKEEKLDLGGAHAFAVTNVDGKKKTITFVNPWDSTKPITMTWKNFIKLRTKNNLYCMEMSVLPKTGNGTAENKSDPPTKEEAEY